MVSSYNKEGERKVGNVFGVNPTTTILCASYRGAKGQIKKSANESGTEKQPKHTVFEWDVRALVGRFARAAKRGGFQTGGFPDLDLSFLFCPFLSFLGLSRFFGIFPICSGMVRDFPDLSFSSFSAY